METTKWIGPEDLARDVRRKTLKNLNNHISKVCAAMVALGHFDFKVHFNLKQRDGLTDVSTEIARIKDLPTDSKYSYIDVYHDGYIGYFDAAGQMQFEGISKISSVKRDILQ